MQITIPRDMTVALIMRKTAGRWLSTNSWLVMLDEIRSLPEHTERKIADA